MDTVALEVLCMLRMHPFVHSQWRNGKLLTLNSEGRAFKPGLRPTGYLLTPSIRDTDKLLAELVQTGCQLYLNLTTIQILHTQRMTLGLVAFES